jgi:hypothetical protein
MTTDEVAPNAIEKNGETNGTEVKKTGIKVIVVGAGTHKPFLIHDLHRQGSPSMPVLT